MAKQFEELNLVDNFLFGAVMSDKEGARILGKTILQAIFGRKFPKLVVHSEHTIWSNSEELHGIRLDAFIEEKNVEILPGGVQIYDLEPNKRKSEKTQLPWRVRFIHSKIDEYELESGDSYDKLKNVWVIFITTYDPFGENRMVYTIKNGCEESPDLPYEDGAVTLFFIPKGKREILRKG